MNETIIIGSSQTMRTIEPLREELLGLFAQHAAVDIDASGLAELDLSFIQLLEAARAHAAREHKSIRLTAPANAALTGLLHRGGFLTDPTPEDIDFWFHGELPQ